MPYPMLTPSIWLITAETRIPESATPEGKGLDEIKEAKLKGEE